MIDHVDYRLIRLDSLLAAVSSEMQRLLAAQAELLSGGEC